MSGMSSRLGIALAGGWLLIAPAVADEIRDWPCH
jgi:hypothetical protein